jgi:hypothetical protein
VIAHAPVSVYGDSAYGAGEVLDTLERADAEINCKVQPLNAPGGRFAKSEFEIDLELGTVSCPAGRTVELRPAGGGQVAYFGKACADCPLLERCTAPHTDARSRSAPTSGSLPAPASAKPTPPGRPTTTPAARRSSARSHT